MKLAALAFTLVLAAPALAQVRHTEHTYRLEEGASPATASLETFAWLVGRWTGEGLGGRIEEIWAPPEDGAMPGMFRLVRDGEVFLYEIFTLRDAGNGLTLRLKHFNADMTGWEEKAKFVEFEYLGADGEEHRFDGLTYRRDGENEMTVFLAWRSGDGTMREEVLKLRRAPF